MDYESEHVMTLANSIIGVSVLAMPYCFKQCGIILSILMLIISSVISRLSCHFLLKSSVIARRKTFEYLAFHSFGTLGKFVIEIGLIGFLLGTCIAYFVVMGDIGPAIIAEITGSTATNTMRSSILMALALFCVLPLGLLRNVDSLAGVNKATIGFYCCLVLKIVVESAPQFVAGEWIDKVELWRPAGILQCIPIFSMALFCQTQLFEVYQTMPNASIEKMNHIIQIATNICTSVYIFVGMFGYIAFYKQPFTGNILLIFRPSTISDVMKLGFVLSVAFSFPLVIFPCRASLYSLIYKRGYSVHEGAASNYIPEGKFKTLTFIIVFTSLFIGVLIPNIELVLGLMGSTIGVMICVLFPVTCFICLSPKNTNERIVAQIVLCVGILIMVLGTYANLYAMEEMHTLTTVKYELQKHDDFLKMNPVNEVQKEIVQQLSTKKVLDLEEHIHPPLPEPNDVKVEPPIIKEVVADPAEVKEIRHEPPQPVEPVDVVVSPKPKNDQSADEILKKEEQVGGLEKQPPALLVEDNKEAPAVPLPPEAEKTKKQTEVEKKEEDLEKRSEEVDIEAIKKEEVELGAQEKEVQKQDLIDTLVKQSEVQQQLVEQQKQLLEVIKQQALENKEKLNEMEKVKKEKMEAVKQIESIAKKAIETLSGNENKNVITSGPETAKEEKAAPQESKPVENVEQLAKKSENNLPKELEGEKVSVNMVPIPIAVSNNLTIYGEPRGVSQDNKDVPKEPAHKENEINIKQVDNMNINIKHEINVNVGSPKSIVDLLKGSKQTSDDNKRETNKEAEKKDEADAVGEKENIQAVRRDILSDGTLNIVREKRSLGDEDVKSLLAKVASTLAEKELLGLGKVNIGNVNKIHPVIVNFKAAE